MSTDARTKITTAGSPLQLILDTALDTVIVMRPDGTVADWNTRAEETFGYSRKQVLNRPMAEMIIPEAKRADHYRGLKHFLKTGKGPLLGRRIETVALRRNGEEFPVELSISPLKYDGELIFVGFLRDISEHKRAQGALAYQARHATLLHKVTSLAAETTSLEEILQACLDAICELTEWPVGHAYLPASNGSDTMVPSTIWHMEAGKYQYLKHATETSKFASGIGLPGHIWKTKQPHWIADVSQLDANFPRFHKQPKLEIRAAFGVPIKVGGQVIAVLEFFNDEVTELRPGLLLTAQAFGEQLGRVLERRQVVEHQQLLLAELNHRVKNLLSVVLGVATQTIRNSKSMDVFQERFTARLMSMSRTYDLLASTQWQATPLDKVIGEIIAPHVVDNTRVTISGPPVALSPKATMAVSMLLHELVTNAVKHGSLSVPDGKIEVNWRVAEAKSSRGEVRLNWQEFGLSGLTPPQDRSGFGTRIIEAMAQHELRGSVAAAYEPGGVRYDLRFPIAS